jgi:hypothetical protein
VFPDYPASVVRSSGDDRVMRGEGKEDKVRA